MAGRQDQIGGNTQGPKTMRIPDLIHMENSRRFCLVV